MCIFYIYIILSICYRYTTVHYISRCRLHTFNMCVVYFKRGSTIHIIKKSPGLK